MNSVHDPFRIPYQACPVCGGEPEWLRNQEWTGRPDYQEPLTPIISWMQCRNCEHQFTSGYHTPEALDIIFGRAQSSQTPVGMSGADFEFGRTSWASLVEKVSALVAEGRWLDVGAGSGLLLTLAGECGFDAVASEIRSDVAQGLRNIGIEVLEDTIENLAEKAPGSFDVISMCDVLEHVAFPLPTLDAVIRLLRPGGVLVISCPNRESKAWTSLSEIHENPYWAEIEHFHNFSFRQIKGWLLERGFTRVHCGVSPRYRLCMEVVAVF